MLESAWDALGGDGHAAAAAADDDDDDDDDGKSLDGDARSKK